MARAKFAGQLARAATMMVSGGERFVFASGSGLLLALVAGPGPDWPFQLAARVSLCSAQSKVTPTQLNE